MKVEAAMAPQRWNALRRLPIRWVVTLLAGFLYLLPLLTSLHLLCMLAGGFAGSFGMRRTSLTRVGQIAVMLLRFWHAYVMCTSIHPSPGSWRLPWCTRETLLSITVLYPTSNRLDELRQGVAGAWGEARAPKN